MKRLTDQLHDQGCKPFKRPLHGYVSLMDDCLAKRAYDSGWFTCAGYPGSSQNEGQDTKTFQDWGFDYPKYDNCDTGKSEDKFTSKSYLFSRWAIFSPL
ncbi:hypothetical protein BDY19DRAFT_253200 [Irpex rosettiformis]|uniref:Uncharacterized protein n=1 Tax=Irpex rosettiformis TaxID=378272 RepID=A0ACB8TZM2_9APHY|nr:hypothetical protein BDY19DRAFT_253200 [Irpex rosettiformis]